MKQWLTLVKLMKNPKSFQFSEFLNNVLQNRLARLLNLIIFCNLLEYIT